MSTGVFDVFVVRAWSNTPAFIVLIKGARVAVEKTHLGILQIVRQIVREGFDDRLGRRNSYGRGVYVTTESCNVNQYIEEGCIILARVVLGHPFVDTAAMLDEPRPPAVPGHDALHEDRKSVRIGMHFASRRSKIYLIRLLLKTFRGRK